MFSVLEIIKRTTDFLEKRGVESARLNSELLIGHALGLKRMQLYLQFERPLTETELEAIRPLVKRRAAREPLQHILGTVSFADLALKVDRRALIPRPETELLVELLRKRLPVKPACILDLGTGSGAIALALASIYPEAMVTAIDNSGDALALARENAERTGLSARVQILRSDWYSNVDEAERFNLIVANPPYLSEQETKDAPPEVRDFEPLVALTSGPDGTVDLERIISATAARLTPAGILACETGIDQHAKLREVASRSGFSRTESLRDLTGRDRFLLAFV
jgi:release factor glutamine methyltransferase